MSQKSMISNKIPIISLDVSQKSMIGTKKHTKTYENTNNTNSQQLLQITMKILKISIIGIFMCFCMFFATYH